jgi:hypothetical protein
VISLFGSKKIAVFRDKSYEIYSKTSAHSMGVFDLIEDEIQKTDGC